MGTGALCGLASGRYDITAVPVSAPVTVPLSGLDHHTDGLPKVETTCLLSVDF